MWACQNLEGVGELSCKLWVDPFVGILAMGGSPLRNCKQFFTYLFILFYY